MLGKKNKHSWNKEEGMAEYERFGNSWSEKSQDHLGSSATEQGASLDPAAQSLLLLSWVTGLSFY